MAGHERIVALDRVGVAYKKGLFGRSRFWAVREVSFELYRGETLGVIGHNGSGKSTLLRLLADVYEADEGEVYRADVRASLLSLQVGFVPHLTGRQNAVLSGMLLGMTRSQVRRSLPQIVEFAELEDFIDQPVRTYSSGMRARLGFSIAWAADPDIILLDEVLGVGDRDFKLKSADAMREKISQNKTAVLVSHQTSMITGLCDRAVWLERGRVMSVGEPSRVVNEYARFRKGDTALVRAV